MQSGEIMKPLNPTQVTLLIDMDAILANIFKYWLLLINNDYNESLTISKLTDWNVSNCTQNATYDQVMNYLKDPNFFEKLEPIPNAIETLKKLHEEGFDIWIVTAPPHGCKFAFSSKQAWVAKYAPFITEDRIIFTQHKDKVRGDILFDDAPHNLNDFPNTAVALNYPFNKDYKGPRVQNWSEFYDFVHEFKAKKELA